MGDISIRCYACGNRSDFTFHVEESALVVVCDDCDTAERWSEDDGTTDDT